MLSDPVPAADRRLLGYALVGLAASGWGCWSVVLRAADPDRAMPAVSLTLFVMLVIGVGGLPLTLRRGALRKRPRHAWLWLLAMGVCDVANLYLVLRALTVGSVAIAVLTHYLAPVFVALVAPLALGERKSPTVRLAVALSFVGLAMLLEPWRVREGPVLLTALLGSGSAVFYAANVLIVKKLGTDFSPTEIQSWHMLPALLPLGLAFPEAGWVLDAPSLRTLGLGAMALGVGCGVAFVSGLRFITASEASVLTLLEPLVAVLLGVFLWNEDIGGVGVIGAAAIVGGAFLAIRGAPAPGAIQG